MMLIMILPSLIAINQKKTKDQSTSTANNTVTAEDIFDENKTKKIYRIQSLFITIRL